MFDSMNKLKKVCFDKIEPLDLMQYVYTVEWFGNLMLIHLKDCLDLLDRLGLGLYSVLFLFELDSK